MKPGAGSKQRGGRARATALTLAVLLVAGCGDEPSYPRDWSPLASTKTTIDGRSCPDLSGTYTLPKTIPTHGAKRKDRFVEVHTFLSVNVYRVGTSNQFRSIPLPAKLRLEGPSANGLRVQFLNAKDEVVTDQTIKAGVDFECLGRWIGDTRPDPTRARPRHFYAKDAEGRLIGHKAYSSGGLVLLLDIIPLPVFVDDREWWRVAPSDR